MPRAAASPARKRPTKSASPAEASPVRLRAAVSSARKRPTRSASPARASPAKTPTKPRAKSQSRAPAAKQGGGAAAVNQITTEYEFGGPAGATAVMIFLPLVILGLYAACGRDGCVTSPASALDVFSSLSLGPLWDWTAASVVVGWTLLHFALYVLLPGPRVEGVVLRDGSRLKYPINGHLAFWVSLVACVHGLPLLGLRLSWLYDHYLQLATASCALSTLLSVYSYAVSFNTGCMLAEGGNSRNPLYDFFIGRPLNPRVGSLDLKACCELRPGLIGI